VVILAGPDETAKVTGKPELAVAVSKAVLPGTTGVTGWLKVMLCTLLLDAPIRLRTCVLAELFSALSIRVRVPEAVVGKVGAKRTPRAQTAADVTGTLVDHVVAAPPLSALLPVIALKLSGDVPSFSIETTCCVLLVFTGVDA